jgi:hypothetical protein
MTYYARPLMAGPTAAISFPALSSLKAHHLTMAAAALPVLGPGWSLDAEVDYDGDLTLVITADPEQSDASSFVLYSAGDVGIRLGRVAKDAWESLGCFATIGDTIRAIAATAALAHTMTDLSEGGS